MLVDCGSQTTEELSCLFQLARAGAGDIAFCKARLFRETGRVIPARRDRRAPSYLLLEASPALSPALVPLCGSSGGEWLSAVSASPFAARRRVYYTEPTRSAQDGEDDVIHHRARRQGACAGPCQLFLPKTITTTNVRYIIFSVCLSEFISLRSHLFFIYLFYIFYIFYIFFFLVRFVLFLLYFSIFRYCFIV